VGTAGWYRVRACFAVSVPAAADNPYASHASRGLVRTDWVEVEVRRVSGDEDRLAAEREAHSLLWQQLRMVLYSTGHETVLLSRGRPALDIGPSSVDATAHAVLGAGPPAGLAAKANLLLACDQIALGAGSRGNQAAAHYQAALEELARVPALHDMPPTGGLEPVLITLRGHCTGRLGSEGAGAEALADLRRRFPSFVAERPWLEAALRGN